MVIIVVIVVVIDNYCRMSIPVAVTMVMIMIAVINAESDRYNKWIVIGRIIPVIIWRIVRHIHW